MLSVVSGERPPPRRVFVSHTSELRPHPAPSAYQRLGQVGRIFVSYRRADDPFGAGLVAAVLRDRFGQHGVFLDTWVLNRRGDPQIGLEEGLDASAVVLVLIGRRWEGLEARRRASGNRDWVAWEIREAADRDLPIV